MILKTIFLLISKSRLIIGCPEVVSLMKDNNIQAFYALVKAGLWEKETLLSQYNEINYEAIMEMAEEQSVIGLVTAGIEKVQDVQKFKSSSIPKEWSLQFIGQTLQIEQQNKDMNLYLARLIEKLRKADVYAVLVKGQGIAQCYKEPFWRSSGDIDLLLSDTNYKKAKQVLMPLAVSVDKEYTSFKHLGMTMEGGYVVELHGTMHSRLSRRVDRVIDEAQRDIFYGGNVRSWNNSNTTVFLPSPDNDVIIIFTHILRHFFFEGIGLRQICDWCRLLWTYRDSLNRGLLESRIKKAGLMSEWRAFGAFAVEYLGMPTEAMPLYSDNAKWSRKASQICIDVLKVGNFGHKHRRDYSGMSYLWRKFVSFWGRLSDILRHFSIFPNDSIVFFGGVLRSGLHAAVRGE